MTVAGAELVVEGDPCRTTIAARPASSRPDAPKASIPAGTKSPKLACAPSDAAPGPRCVANQRRVRVDGRRLGAALRLAAVRRDVRFPDRLPLFACHVDRPGCEWRRPVLHP